MKRREQQAEYDRVSEIHRGRLESSSVDATDAATVHLRCVHVWLFRYEKAQPPQLE